MKILISLLLSLSLYSDTIIFNSEKQKMENCIGKFMVVKKVKNIT